MQKTIREVISSVNLNNIFTILANNHLEANEDKSFDEHFEECKKSYAATINELLAYPPCDNPHEVIVKLITEKWGDYVGETYMEFTIKNNDFIRDPEPNLEPWGGGEDENDCPEGHYNCNWRGYQREYGIAGLDRAKFAWGKFILDDSVVNHDIEEILAEFLWELTFEGFLEKDSQKFWDDIKNDVDETSEDDWIEWNIDET